MDTLPGERKALLFSVGSVRLSLRLTQVREIQALSREAADVTVRGEVVPTLPIGIALGLRAVQGGFALVTEAVPVSALRVDAIHGIVDLLQAEVFQLPARTQLPQPPPFVGAIVRNGEIALELSLSAMGWAPIEPAPDPLEPPPEASGFHERELFFARSGKTYAVPLSLVVQVLEAPHIWSVPLAPAAHRGLLYHGRAIHPVFDVALLYGDVSGDDAGREVPQIALLLDAGGTPVGVLADRMLGVGETSLESEVTRPSWDALFVQ